MADDAEGARDIVQHLGDVLAQRPQCAAAFRTGAGGGVFHDVARQCLRQRPAGRLAPRGRPLVSGAAGRCGSGRRGLGDLLFDVFEHQLEWQCYRILAQECWRILAHPPSLNLRSPDWIGGPFVDWKAKVDLFEQLRREHEFGIGTIAGVAAKFGVHRRLVRQAIASALPPAQHYPERIKPKLGVVAVFIDEVLEADRLRAAQAAPHRAAHPSPDPEGIPRRRGR